MAAFDETSDRSQPASPRGPVFVDESGRRLRRVKFIGLGALGLVAGYVILLLVSFIGGSNIAAPYLPLPIPAAAPAPDSPSAPASNAAGLPTGQAQSAGPAAPAAFEATVPRPSAVPAAPPTNAAAVLPAAPVATSAPSTEPTNSGKSATAPGQTTRPSTPAHP